MTVSLKEILHVHNEWVIRLKQYLAFDQDRFNDVMLLRKHVFTNDFGREGSVLNLSAFSKVHFTKGTLAYQRLCFKLTKFKVWSTWFATQANCFIIFIKVNRLII